MGIAKRVRSKVKKALPSGRAKVSWENAKPIVVDKLAEAITGEMKKHVKAAQETQGKAIDEAIREMRSSVADQMAKKAACESEGPENPNQCNEAFPAPGFGVNDFRKKQFDETVAEKMKKFDEDVQRRIKEQDDNLEAGRHCFVAFLPNEPRMTRIVGGNDPAHVRAKYNMFFNRIAGPEIQVVPLDRPGWLPVESPTNLCAPTTPPDSNDVRLRELDIATQLIETVAFNNAALTKIAGEILSHARQPS